MNGLSDAFEEKLLKVRNEIRVRRLTKKLYDAKDNLDKAFTGIDAVNRELRIMKSLEAKQRMEEKK